jgi:hypothetical protein
MKIVINPLWQDSTPTLGILDDRDATAPIFTPSGERNPVQVLNGDVIAKYQYA